MSGVRTRFAPSPTGYLHLGGARTALFNYLFARHHHGRFVLRIEDTDRERSRPEFTHAILAGLEWLGLDYDEGPVFQSERSDLYAERVAHMLASGSAYHCFCSAETLDAKRKQAQATGRTPAYDRTCRDLGRRPAPGEAAVVRLRAPLEGETVVDDLIRGPVRFAHAELDDLILVRSDGTPTFHLVVVVDDIEMEISHVLRGEDHLTNTPKQIQIFRALSGEVPRYGHLPLIVGQDRARLSKRHGATALDAYRDAGFLPSAVLNYLARLGWSHGDREIFTKADLIELFDVEACGKAAAAFDMEKFSWVNGQHMRSLDDASLARATSAYFSDDVRRELDEADLVAAISLLRERAKTLIELAEMARSFVSDRLVWDSGAVAKFLDDSGRASLALLGDALADVDPWTLEGITAAFAQVVARLDTKLGKLAQPARVALTGGTVSPGIYEVCHVLGKERTLKRLREARALGEEGSSPTADPTARG